MIEVGDNMSTKRKRKIRIKWKNLFILFSIIFLFFFLVTKGTISLHNWITSPKEEKKPKKTLEEQKLEKLNNINTQIDYFNNEYLDRYLSYKENNPNLDIIQVIKNVNMNLDLEPYEYTFETKNTNTEKLLVNKYYYLTEDYVPDNLVAISRQYALSNMRMVNYAKEAFEELSKEAKNENLNVIAMSTYRSYTYQVNI